MAADNKNKLVLVTGGTGFISSHTVKAFLDNGYRVRTTARSPENREKCKALYTLQASLDDPSRLEIVKAADLLEPECWKEAAKGCDLCAHLASPFFIARNKKDEIQMCAAAEQGTLNVLRACEEAGIKRVVVTSSMAAVLPGHTGLAGTTIDKPEEMWAVEAKVDGYTLSKLRAERAVWRYVKEENKNGMEVSTINPCWVVGPPLSGNNATSHELLAQMFARKLPVTIHCTLTPASLLLNSLLLRAYLTRCTCFIAGHSRPRHERRGRARRCAGTCAGLGARGCARQALLCGIRPRVRTSTRR